mmetsp:Transcript_18238/g.25641  ORF Transcript_18238/g.25641 Transcript_18238/m.25641 type:complete len:83 (-) Transcript_18238:274-522(-)
MLSSLLLDTTGYHLLYCIALLHNTSRDTSIMGLSLILATRGLEASCAQRFSCDDYLLLLAFANVIHLQCDVFRRWGKSHAAL